MELGQFQKQTMRLVMTTELRQAINLLQYSTQELSQFIQEQALENPLIEMEEIPEIRIEERYGEIRNRSNSFNNSDHSVDPLNLIANEEKGLIETLMEQIQWLEVNNVKRDILNYLVLNIDSNGYLSLSSKEAAHQLNVNEQIIEECIHFLHQLEPVGIGARNLKECLLLQAQVCHPDEPLVTCVISDYLDLIANNSWNDLSQKLDISLAEVNRIVKIIQTLDPKPGSQISYAATQYIEPDIMIESLNGNYTISLNETYLPKFKINRHYHSLINPKNEVSDYIRGQYQKYLWLVKSIEQRRTTILKITKVIVEKQKEFLINGFAFLSPLTLKEVADEINMHESTVSRATNNKFIQTPIGTFEMRRLFTSKLSKSDGSSTSSSEVKYLLREYIDQEDKQRPYSDQKLSNLFKENYGINISRRTIAKYREELNILSSSKRKSIV